MAEGGLKDTLPEDLLVATFEGVLTGQALIQAWCQRLLLGELKPFVPRHPKYPNFLFSKVRSCNPPEGPTPLGWRNWPVSRERVDENEGEILRLLFPTAGFSVSSYVSTVNRQCSSGLAAVNAVAKSIATGEIEVGIAAGVESMSLHFGPQALEHKVRL